MRWDLIFLQKYVSLNQNKDFKRLYYKGKSVQKPVLVVYAMKNRAGLCRVGITTGKKIGSADIVSVDSVSTADIREIGICEQLINWIKIMLVSA